jgi:lipid-A-disaccharide synthase
MAVEGQQQTVRAEDVAVMGITEILLHIPGIVGSYRKLVRSIRRDKPAVAVLIDFPDVNFRLAKHLHTAGVPVIWFVSPQLWAWKRSRLRWVQQRVSKMMVIFPFEETFYRKRDVAAEFVGHPLAETALPIITREDYAARHNLDLAKTWIALLPGSRWKEIRANLPTLHELAVSDLISTHSAEITFDGDHLELPTNAAAHTRYEFLLPVASTIDPTALAAYLQTLNAEHVKYLGPEASTLRLTLVPDAREALFHARASVVASGTATIQAAVIGNPFVVVYRVSPLTFALAKKLVRYPDEFPDMTDSSGNLPIAMVNLIAQRRLVPELLQQNFTAANVAQALSPLFADTPERQQQIAGLAEVRSLLRAGAGDSIVRLANAILSALTSESVQSTSNN